MTRPDFFGFGASWGRGRIRGMLKRASPNLSGRDLFLFYSEA
jgi:hypothetical protein